MDKAATWLTSKWRAWLASAIGRAVNRLAVVLVAAALLGWLLRLAGQAVLGDFIPFLGAYTSTLTDALALLIPTLLVWKFWEKRPLQKLGLQVDSMTLPDLVFGLAAVTFFALIAGLLLGYLTPLRRLLGFVPFVATLSTAVLLAISQEIFFRRYLLQGMTDVTHSVWWGVGISSLFFAVYRAPSVSLFIVDFVVGCVLSYTVISSRQLWAALGIQVAWYTLVPVMTLGGSAGHVEFVIIGLTAVTAFTYLQVLTNRYWRVTLHEPN